MKIGLWSDCINFPSLPLMKISAWHKQQGDDVELLQPLGNYDKVYLSKTFNLPAIKKIPQAPPLFSAKEIVKGGTGWSINVDNGREVFDKGSHLELPPEVEHICPDYDLYPEFKHTAYGFLTRGCPNGCGFCIVSKKEGIVSHKVADLSEFWRGQKNICLLDPNLLACPDRVDLLKQIIDSGARVDFNQGLDARMMDDEVAELLSKIKIAKVHFAMDLPKNKDRVIKGIQTFLRYYKGNIRSIRCYVLTNYNTTLEQDWARVKALVDIGIHPDVRIYQKGTHPKFITDLARWCNNPILFYSSCFADYVPRKDGIPCGELYKDILGGSDG